MAFFFLHGFREDTTIPVLFDPLGAIRTGGEHFTCERKLVGHYLLRL